MPENGLTSCLTELIVVFKGHTMHMNITVSYPTAQNMLLSADCDNVMLVWSIGGCIACALTSSIMSAGVITDVSNSQFAKDKSIYIIAWLQNKGRFMRGPDDIDHLASGWQGIHHQFQSHKQLASGTLGPRKK